VYGTDFQLNVMAKLDIIIENQQEQLMLLRQIAVSNNSCGSAEVIDELIPSQFNTTEELRDFDEKLRDTEFKKKMVNTAHFLF
jgi:hypothetical protein